MRAFPYLAGLNVLIGIVAALAVALTFQLPASKCQFNGIACSDISGVYFASLVIAPLAMFGLFVLAGIRVRRYRPKVALALVALPPVAISALVVRNLLGVYGV